MIMIVPIASREGFDRALPDDICPRVSKIAQEGNVPTFALQAGVAAVYRKHNACYVVVCR